MKPKVKKISMGTYKVTFSKTQVYTVVIPNLWLEIGDEVLCKQIAIECASEQLECIDD